MAIRTNNGDYAYPDMSYRGCRWCRGRGCLQCPQQAEAAYKRAMEPIFTANTDDPEQMEEARRVIGMEALEKAFGPNGGGVQEIELNAAVTMLTRALRERCREGEPPVVQTVPEMEPDEPRRTIKMTQMTLLLDDDDAA